MCILVFYVEYTSNTTSPKEGSSSSLKVYSFPVAYSSAVYMMSANPKGNVGTGATKNAHSANVESLTQFSISVGEHSSMFWFSIGK